MMENKYQLVAWTENIADKENARLSMIPSLESEIMAPLVEDLANCHRAEYEVKGVPSLALTRRRIRSLERMSRFYILTGHYGAGIRYLLIAARYCIRQGDFNRADRHTDRGSHSRLYAELRHEYVRLCQEARLLARKYGREDVLHENRLL